jgi:hypothetical protein
MSGHRSAAVGATIPRIRDAVAYAEGQWDLDIFAGCFGNTKIQACDVDGVVAAVTADTLSVVERRGRVLFFEFKSPGSSVALGQDLLFRALSEPAGHHVMVVRGLRNEPEDHCVWTRNGPGRWIPSNLDQLRDRVKRWWTWANGPWPEAA